VRLVFPSSRRAPVWVVDVDPPGHLCRMRRFVPSPVLARRAPVVSLVHPARKQATSASLAPRLGPPAVVWPAALRGDGRLAALGSAAGVVATAAVLAACPPAPPPPPAASAWRPGVVLPADGPVARGFIDVRGLIHAHSVYSHDACDGEPVLADGSIDPVCFDDFRRGLCQSGHDFVFLTDHGNRFQTTEYPDALLYRPDLGDVLVERDGLPVANRVTCDEGHPVLIMAGSENGLMPVGLERHVAVDAAGRDAAYGPLTVEAADALRAAGAVVLLAHPEDYTVDELRQMPLDGFEMYNLHANTELGAGFALDLLVRANDGDPTLPHPDLLVLALMSEDPRYLERWGRVLAGGKRLTTTMGTDCHRNTFRTILADGERADSYRRMMLAFSNHLRVTAGDDGVIDDDDLKAALRGGRAWGAFEVMGYPTGFDARATKDGATFELGDVVPVGATLHVDAPRVRDLDPAVEAPRLTLRVLRAVDAPEGFVEVARGEDATLEVVADQPGAWRVEVRMLPLHLRNELGDDVVRLIDEAELAGVDYPWVYANPFYVE
jgi:hypothetical protein